jgi:23S rRNA pseudouridine2605 synthase
MRINKFVAQATGMSRRRSDGVVAEGSVKINDKTAQIGDVVDENDTVTLNGKPISVKTTQTIMLNKPAGYICSRDGQGGETIYHLLPSNYHHLKPVGRLDKESSGLLILTNDGDLANRLTHPSYEKPKNYDVTLKTPLQPLHRQMIQEHGIQLEYYVSKFSIERLHDADEKAWRVTLKQGKNRQIRKTFGALGYTVTKLHRTHFGPYALGNLASGKSQELMV